MYLQLFFGKPPRAGGHYDPAMPPDVALSGLFVSAFLSSTLLPGSSEVVLAALVANAPELFWPAIAVATVGNTLGGLTSYALGRLVPQPKTRPRALEFAQRYGVAVLLLSWLPVIGDALCVASGWLRHDVILATVAIAVGELARYVVLAAAVRGLAG
jgi:membrane protein YqaA with SNARE-associated domain